MHPAILVWRSVVAATVLLVWVEALLSMYPDAECKSGEVMVPYFGQHGGGVFCVTGYKYVPEWRRSEKQ